MATVDETQLGAPIAFTPILKQKVWGGSRLASVFGRDLGAEERIGEAWEISDYGDDHSRVLAGPLAGRTLRELIETASEALLGERAERFPLLLKSLDATSTLSIQLHPSDEDALRIEKGGRGKTEAWAIIDAEPGAKIIHGIAPGLEPRDVFERVARLGAEDMDAASELFAWRVVRRGDVVFLPAGTIHAIGAGIVLVEVQQSSDFTYRIYDWANDRELHLEKAAQVTPPQEPPPLEYPRWLPESRAEASRRTLVRCEYFSMEALFTPAGAALDVDARAGRSPRFGVLIGLVGEAELEYAGEHGRGSRALKRGDFFLLPATIGEFSVRGVGSEFVGLWVQP